MGIIGIFGAGYTIYQHRHRLLFEFLDKKTDIYTYLRTTYNKYFPHVKVEKNNTVKAYRAVVDSTAIYINSIPKWNDNIERIELITDDYINVYTRPQEINFPVYTSEYIDNAFSMVLDNIESNSILFDKDQVLKYAGPLGDFYMDSKNRVKLEWIMTVDGDSMFSSDDTLTISDAFNETTFKYGDYLGCTKL